MWFSTYAMLFDFVENLNITFEKAQEIDSTMIWVISYGLIWYRPIWNGRCESKLDIILLGTRIYFSRMPWSQIVPYIGNSFEKFKFLLKQAIMNVNYAFPPVLINANKVIPTNFSSSSIFDFQNLRLKCKSQAKLFRTYILRHVKLSVWSWMKSRK